MMDERAAVSFRDWKERLAAEPGGPYTKEGVPWEVSTPATVRAALADHGLMGTAKQPHQFLRGALLPVIKELANRAYTQTTENGQRKYVKVTPTIIASPTHHTRNGDPEVGWALYVVTKARTTAGDRPVALDHKSHSYAQAPAQAIWNHAIGRRLLDRGILVLPTGKSTAAFGYTAQSKGSARLQAAGVGNSSAAAKKVVAKKTRPKKTGPAQHAKQATAKQATGKKTTAKKQGAAKTTRAARHAAAKQARAARAAARKAAWDNVWKAAVRDFAWSVKEELTDAVKGFAVKATGAVRKRMAFRAVRAAYKIHLQSGAPRFSEASVRATAHALATPHVGVKLLDAAFAKVSADLDRLGVRVVKNYQTGNRMLSPAVQQAQEQKLGAKLDAATKHRTSGGTPKAVIKALAGKNLTAEQYTAAIEIAGPGRVVFANPRRPQAVAHAAAAFRHHKKNVY